MTTTEPLQTLFNAGFTDETAAEALVRLDAIERVARRLKIGTVEDFNRVYELKRFVAGSPVTPSTTGSRPPTACGRLKVSSAAT